MLECQNCKHKQEGRGPILCPECGYIMHEMTVKKAKKIIDAEVKDGINLGDKS